MKKLLANDGDIKALTETLGSEDGIERQHARESLVVIGSSAAPFLIRSLEESTSDQVRWEAAKALGEIVDERSIPVLVRALEDSNSDVTWLAAEALINFKVAAWQPLLRALLRVGPNSELRRIGAHHVLVNQEEAGLQELLSSLVLALASDAAPELMPPAAEALLSRLEHRS